VAALAALSSASLHLIADLMRGHRNDGVLIPCKAAGLKWPTVNAILETKIAHHPVSERDLAAAKTDYLRFSQSSAQRILRFWQVRTTTSRPEGPKAAQDGTPATIPAAP